MMSMSEFFYTFSVNLSEMSTAFSFYKWSSLLVIEVEDIDKIYSEWTRTV